MTQRQILRTLFLNLLKTLQKLLAEATTLILIPELLPEKEKFLKSRVDEFFRLKQCEFTYPDGEDKKVQFKLLKIERAIPYENNQFSQADLAANFKRVYDNYPVNFPKTL